MAVTDTGWYATPYRLRDQIVWPPGWELPAATEMVTLDASLTVGSEGATIAGYTKAAGERWVDRASATWSHRVGFVPGSAAGSYVAGDTVPMYRHPRFIAAKRTYRSANSPTFSSPTVRPSFAGLSEATTSFQRFGSGLCVVRSALTGGFRVGDVIVVGGLSNPSFNGTFTITVVSTGNQYAFPNPGPVVGSTADTNGRISVLQPDAVRRMHQFGGLRSWTRATGPAPGTPSTASSPLSGSLTWIYQGVTLQQVLVMAEPFDRAFSVSSGTGAFPGRMARVWAPVAAEISRDFAVDATLPDYGQVRVVWVDGIPQCSYPSGVTAPYPGATRTARQRGHTDRLTSRDGVALYATMPEDAGRVRSLVALGTPLLDGRGATAIRSDLFDAMWCRTSNGPQTASAAPFSAITLTGQWYRSRVNGAAVTVGASFSVAYSVLTFGANDYLDADDSAIPVPLDGSYGNTPGIYFLRVEYLYTISGIPRTYTTDYYFQGDSSGGENMRVTAFVPKLIPWPYDVPRMAFAADDASTQYVGHAGWLMPPCVYPVTTVVPPALSRGGTTITATAGSCSVAPPEDGLAYAFRGVALRAIAKAVNAGGVAGSVASGPTITTTVAAFSGETVDAEANDVWSIDGSHVGSYGPRERFGAKVVQNLP